MQIKRVSISQISMGLNSLKWLLHSLLSELVIDLQQYQYQTLKQLLWLINHSFSLWQIYLKSLIHCQKILFSMLRRQYSLWTIQYNLLIDRFNINLIVPLICLTHLRNNKCIVHQINKMDIYTSKLQTPSM